MESDNGWKRKWARAEIVKNGVGGKGKRMTGMRRNETRRKLEGK